MKRIANSVLGLLCPLLLVLTPASAEPSRAEAERDPAVATRGELRSPTAAATAKPAPFRFILVDDPDANSLGTSWYGINNEGVLAGNWGTGSVVDSLVYDHGTFIDVPIGPGGYSELNDVNENGVSVGFYCGESSCDTFRSFVRQRDGTISELPDPVPGAVANQAFGVNNRGDIVGRYYPDSSYSTCHGYLFRKGVYRTIDLPGATCTGIFGINEHDQVVGRWIDASGQSHGFRMDLGDANGHHPGPVVDVEVPGADATRPRGINNAGEIVGFYVLGGIDHGFLLDRRGFTLIDVPGASDTDLLGINDRGEMAGTYDGFSRGVVVAP